MEVRLNLLVLRCNSIEKSKDFYEKLGLSFKQEQHGNGPVHYAAEFGGLVFELYPIQPNEAVDRSRLGFSLDTYDVSELLRDVEIEVISSYEFNNKLVLVVQDPDARKVELCQVQL
jgi:lactoylglutathione lyase